MHCHWQPSVTGSVMEFSEKQDNTYQLFHYDLKA